ncbi:unnamed protein product [Pedinophyceae sp. YPF-701]|nr:unnamed protein product [Pedinophyceae sp. YPF-701]
MRASIALVLLLVACVLEGILARSCQDVPLPGLACAPAGHEYVVGTGDQSVRAFSSTAGDGAAEPMNRWSVLLDMQTATTEAQRFCAEVGEKGLVEACEYVGLTFMTMQATASQLYAVWEEYPGVMEAALVEQAHTAMHSRVWRLFGEEDVRAEAGEGGGGGTDARRGLSLSGQSCQGTSNAAGQVLAWNKDSVDNPTGARDRCYTTKFDGTAVAGFVVDEQVRIGHVEFQGRATEFTTSPSVTERNGQNGQTHGTHVAGIMGGRDFGFATKLDVFGCTVSQQFTQNGQTVVVLDSSLINAALIKIAAEGRRPAVVNLSIGDIFYSYSVFSTTIDHILHDLGVLVVRASGNERSLAHLIQPGHSQRALQVAAATESSSTVDGAYEYTNFGHTVDIFAPGGGSGKAVLAAGASSDTAVAQLAGTSMAAPAVAAVAALYLQHSPNTNVDALHRIVELAASSVITSHRTLGENSYSYKTWTNKYLQTSGIEKASLLYTNVTGVNVTADNSTHAFELYLRQQPNATVTVTLSSSHPEHLTVSPSTLTFAAGSTASPSNSQTVTVRTSPFGAILPVTWVDVTVSSSDTDFDGAVHAVAFMYRNGTIRGTTASNPMTITDMGSPNKPSEIWYDLNEINAIRTMDHTGQLALTRWGQSAVRIDGIPPFAWAPFTCEGAGGSTNSNANVQEDFWFNFQIRSGCASGCKMTVDTCGSHFDAALRVWDFSNLTSPALVKTCTIFGDGDDMGTQRLAWWPGLDHVVTSPDGSRQQSWADVTCARQDAFTEVTVVDGKRYSIQVGKFWHGSGSLSSSSYQATRLLALHTQLDRTGVVFETDEQVLVGHDGSFNVSVPFVAASATPPPTSGPATTAPPSGGAAATTPAPAQGGATTAAPAQTQAPAATQAPGSGGNPSPTNPPATTPRPTPAPQPAQVAVSFRSTFTTASADGSLTAGERELIVQGLMQAMGLPLTTQHSTTFINVGGRRRMLQGTGTYSVSSTMTVSSATTANSAAASFNAAASGGGLALAISNAGVTATSISGASSSVTLVSQNSATPSSAFAALLNSWFVLVAGLAASLIATM